MPRFSRLCERWKIARLPLSCIARESLYILPFAGVRFKTFARAHLPTVGIKSLENLKGHSSTVKNVSFPPVPSPRDRFTIAIYHNPFSRNFYLLRRILNRRREILESRRRVIKSLANLLFILFFFHFAFNDCLMIFFFPISTILFLFFFFHKI